MTKTKSSLSDLTHADRASVPVQTTADAMFRAASECLRQHRRHSALVELDVSEAEEQAAERVRTLSDTLMSDAASMYEAALTAHEDALQENEPLDEWRQRADQLWQAVREYEKRHQASERATKQLQSHDLQKLLSITLEFEIEASALLQLQHAADAYRKVRPEAVPGTVRP
jgi:hypothetical protein